MTKFYTFGLFVLACLCFGISSGTASSVLYTQYTPSGDTSTRNKVSLVSARNMDSTSQSDFLADTPKLFAVAPGMPLFTIVGQDNSFFLGIGGYAKATFSYDWGAPLKRATHFTTSSINMNPQPGNNHLTQIGLGTTNAFINFVGLPNSKNRVSVYINANLAAANYGVNLLFAYINYRGFTAGYDFSLFSDVGATNPSIDFEGPNGLILTPNTVINYKHNFGRHFTAAVGVEMPTQTVIVEPEYSGSVYQSVPDVPFYLQYSWAERTSWVRAAGLLRGLTYRDLTQGVNRTSLAWGLNLSTTFLLARKLRFCAQVAGGYGISDYFQDSFRMHLDMLPDPVRHGMLQTVGSIGATVGLRYDFTDAIFASCTYSILRLKSAGYYQEDMFKGSDYAVANLFWMINPRIYLGVEYLWGQRIDMNDRCRANNRAQGMIQVKF